METTKKKLHGMHSIIDIEGIIDFYKDGPANWGTDPDKRCNADPFYKLLASKSVFIGQTGGIQIWEPDRKYTWRVNNLDDEHSILTKHECPENNIILKFVNKKVGIPIEAQWKKILDWDELHFKLGADGELIISETSPNTFKISTASIIDADINLSYTINFGFMAEGEIRHGRIDPYVQIRSGGGNHTY